MSVAHLLTQSIVVRAEKGRSSHGDITFGMAIEMPARVERKAKMVRNITGEERVSTDAVITETEIALSSRVWLPDDDISEDNEGRTVLMVEKASKPGGYTFYQTWL